MKSMFEAGRFSRLVMIVVLLFFSAILNTVRPENYISEYGNRPEQEDISFKQSLNALSTDSIFSLGTSYFSLDSIPLDKIMICYVTAQHRLRQEQKRGNRKNIEAIVKSYINTAYIYSSYYMNYSEAYMNLHKAEKICKENRLDSLIATVQHSLAVLHTKNENLRPGRLLSRNRHNNGNPYYLKAFESARRAKIYDIMSYAIYNYVDNSINSPSAPDRPDIKEMAAFTKRYLSSKIPDSIASKDYITNMCRGLISCGDGDYEKAIEYYSKMIPAGFPIRRDSIKMAENRDNLIAIAYEMMGEADKSKDILTGNLTDAIRRNDPGSQLSLYLRLYRLHTATNRQEEAKMYLSKYLAVRENIAATGNNEATITEIELKQSVIDYENSLNAAAAKERQNRILLICISVTGILVIIVLALSLYYAIKRRKYIMALYEKNISAVSSRSDKLPAAKAVEAAEQEKSVSDNRLSARNAEKTDTELIERITDILSNDETVLDPDYQMAQLCAQVGSNPTYVSRAINAHYGKNFKSVLTERRIKEACRRFDNPEYNATLTIEAICMEVGFRSRTAFATAFRNVTGLTPSEYRQAARKYMPAHNPAGNPKKY